MTQARRKHDKMSKNYRERVVGGNVHRPTGADIGVNNGKIPDNRRANTAGARRGASLYISIKGRPYPYGRGSFCVHLFINLVKDFL